MFSVFPKEHASVLQIMWCYRRCYSISSTSKYCACVWAGTRFFSMDSAREDLRHLFKTGVESVETRSLIKETVIRYGERICVSGQYYGLNHNCYIVGFGKAVLGMAMALENLIGDHIVRGIISIPIGTKEIFGNKADMWPRQESKIKVYEGAKDNMPDKRAQIAARKIETLLKSVQRTDIVFVLISGGGSALLPSPSSPTNLEEKLDIIRLLANRGASITEVNKVRKCLSYLKGGGLAILAYPAKVVALILSDVIGDSLETIASGPTCPFNVVPANALAILSKYGMLQSVHNKVAYSISKNCHMRKTLPITDGSYDHVQNVLIGNNKKAIKAVFKEALKMDYYPVVATSQLKGNARDVGVIFAECVLANCAILNSKDANFDRYLDTFKTLDVDGKLEILQRTLIPSRSMIKRGFCLIFGGETTVKVNGTGRGGRNQELALSFALHLASANINNDPHFLSNFAICLLCAGTDGIDGPTDAAGALGYEAQIVKQAVIQKLNARQFLDNNDSNTFFKLLKGGEDLVITGHTGTNVMDLYILLIKPMVVIT